jgi:chromosome partitioning protein
MKVWALVSQKGGSGRSTLSTQLAAYACQLGEKVAILDLDQPQRSATAWHELRGRGESPAVMPCLPERLAKLVEAIRESGLATLVIIDTPPHTANGAVEAITAADLVISPIRPGMFDIRSIEMTVELINSAEAMNKTIGVVNAVRVGKGAVGDYNKASSFLERYGMRVASTYIGDRRAFTVAIENGKGVTESKSKDNKEAAAEIVGLWSELNETWPVVAAHERAAP